MNFFKSILLLIILTSCVKAVDNAKNTIKGKEVDDCEQRLDSYKESVNTDTTTLDIGTKLYRSYNCDSIWLTYVNKKNQKKILETWTGENAIFSVRMGLNYLTDYKKYILFQQAVISGCCVMPDTLLFDKNTGEEVKNLGPVIWYSEDKKFPLVICLEDKDTLNTAFENMIIHNLDTDKQYNYSLKNISFFKNLNSLDLAFDRNLLQDFSVKNNNLNLKFIKEDDTKEGKFIKHEVKLDLNNYCN